MICFGRSNYFRFNHPTDKESVLPTANGDMSPVSFYPVDNPEYFHMTGQASTETVVVGGLSTGATPLKTSLKTQTIDNESLQSDDSDNDLPPEVPPRSEAPAIDYVNAPMIMSSSTICTNTSSSFLGDYIYTKAETEPGAATCDQALNSNEKSGLATVISHDGTTTIHNTLYCSDLPPFAKPNLHAPPTYSHHTAPPPALSPHYQNTPPLAFPQVPAPPPPGSPGVSLNGFIPTSPTPDTHATEASKLKVCAEAREKENAETERLDEILSMCAEYERQTSNDSPKVSPHPTLTQNRIKTNGSLPRDKRSPSRYTGSPLPMMGVASPLTLPPLSPTSPAHMAGIPSDDELVSIFNFDGTARTASLSRNAGMSAYPPFPSNTLTSPTSPLTTRSPYENVSTYHHPTPPSPRTRIRTTAKDLSPDAPPISEFGTFGKIAKESSLYGTIRPKESPDAPVKPPRSPRMQRPFLQDMGAVITNKYFAPVTPTKKSAPPIPHYCSPSSFPVFKNHLDSRIKNKVFEEHMLKNIQDSLNVENVNEEIERLKNDKQTAMHSTAQIRRQIDDIERQENELLRELDMERALLEAELATTRHLLACDHTRSTNLQLQSDQMELKHRQQRQVNFDCLQCCKARLDDAEKTLENMEWKTETFDGTTDEETLLLESLKAQHDSVESERKSFEDIEFSQMESEAHRESEREELNKEIHDLADKLEKGKESIAELESQVAAMTASVCQETESLEQQKHDLIAKINKERMSLSSIDRQFGELERLGVMSPHGDFSPCSSDTDESCSPELAEKLAKLNLLDRSQDDLDLIHQVTTSSPLGYSDASLGRKTSATLQEIEKNRQLLLARKGTSVIDNERKRVEELKQRVADEVKAQWQLRKIREQREANCNSLNSVGSDHSSLTSSDPNTQSVSSDDVNGQRNSAASSNAKIKLRQKENDITSDDSLRPTSDTSSFCDSEGAVVRLRKDKSRTQRPLTRYLPVRAEAPFDLRQHIESAGHQVDQCSHVSVSATACRGYLCKLGSKFKTWKKRWFVFDRTQRAFIYFGDKNENKSRGGAYFQDIVEVYVDHSMKAPQANLTFCVKTNERVFHLMARSPEAMRIWIDVIFTGAEGYRQFQNGS